MIDYWFVRLVILLSFASSSYCQEDLFYSACIDSFDCGSLKNLSYPFWTDIDNGRSEMCGSEGFNLRCIDDAFPVITIENQEFFVLSVNQSQNEMAIARMDLWNDSCPDDLTTFTNITLNTALFSFVPDFYTKFSNISLFYNCTNLQNTSTQRFVCSVNGEESEAFYGYESQYDRLQWMEESSKSCNIKVDIPVPDTSGCAWCTPSGGICGTNLSTGGFICMCPDKPYSKSCPNKAGNRCISWTY